MSTTAELFAVGIVLTDLALLSSSRMGGLVRAMVVQGLAIGLYPLLAWASGLSAWAVAFGLAAGAVKGVVFPWLLMRTLRRTGVSREVEPFVGVGLSLVVGLAAFAVAVWMGSRFSLADLDAASRLLVPVALFTAFVGLFLIVSRRKALTQAMGYLVFENGIYLFGVALVGELPFLVEFGILLDAYVALFVMGIATYHINREFHHIDTDRLSRLKG
jgi:hydrogenase-4 component E